MKVQPVLINSVHQVWPEVEGYLKKSCDSQGSDWTVDQAKLLVVNGKWQLVVFTDEGKIKGAALVDYINRPNDRVAFVTGLGGSLISTPEGFEGLKRLVKANGATKFEGGVRPEMVRLCRRKYGMTEKCTIVEVAL